MRWQSRSRPERCDSRNDVTHQGRDPGKAGAHCTQWVPAFAGMTCGCVHRSDNDLAPPGTGVSPPHGPSGQTSRQWAAGKPMPRLATPSVRAVAPHRQRRTTSTGHCRPRMIPRWSFRRQGSCSATFHRLPTSRSRRRPTALRFARKNASHPLEVFRSTHSSCSLVDPSTPPRDAESATPPQQGQARAAFNAETTSLCCGSGSHWTAEAAHAPPPRPPAAEPCP